MERIDLKLMFKIFIIMSIVSSIIFSLVYIYHIGAQNITLKEIIGVSLICCMLSIPISFGVTYVIWSYKDVLKGDLKGKLIFASVVIAMILRALYQMKLHK